MAIGGIALAFLAGLLSVLSPCVVPILPIVLGAAASKHRLGPVALAAGLSVSFVVVGLFLATAGYAIGLSGEALRSVAAVLIIAVGAVLMLPPLQARLAMVSGPIGAWTDQHRRRPWPSATSPRCSRPFAKNSNTGHGSAVRIVAQERACRCARAARRAPRGAAGIHRHQQFTDVSSRQIAPFGLNTPP
jgi:hypothetical protein